MQLLKLGYNCLNYDFIGTSTDESSDDLCTVQIPTSWRSGPRAAPSRVSMAMELVLTSSSVVSARSVSRLLHPAALLQPLSFHPSIPLSAGK